MAGSVDPPDGPPDGTPEGHPGGGEDEYRSVVFDESFIRAARLQELSAQERLDDDTHEPVRPRPASDGYGPTASAPTPEYRRPRHASRTGALALVLVVAMIFAVTVHLASRAPTGPPPVRRAEPARLTLVPLAPLGPVPGGTPADLFARSPAAEHRTGAAGISPPPARRTAHFTSGQVLAALTIAKDYLVQSSLDPDVLRGATVRPVRLLLDPDQLAQFDRSADSPSADTRHATGGWLIRLDPARVALADPAIRVNGALHVAETSPDTLEVNSHHTFTYALHPTTPVPAHGPLAPAPAPGPLAPDPTPGSAPAPAPAPGSAPAVGPSTSPVSAPGPNPDPPTGPAPDSARDQSSSPAPVSGPGSSAVPGPRPTSGRGFGSASGPVPGFGPGPVSGPALGPGAGSAPEPGPGSGTGPGPGSSTDTGPGPGPGSSTSTGPGPGPGSSTSTGPGPGSGTGPGGGVDPGSGSDPGPGAAAPRPGTGSAIRAEARAEAQYGAEAADASLFTVRRELRFRFDRDDLRLHRTELVTSRLWAGPMDCAADLSGALRPLLAGERATATVAPPTDPYAPGPAASTSLCATLAEEPQPTAPQPGAPQSTAPLLDVPVPPAPAAGRPTSGITAARGPAASGPTAGRH